MNGIAGAANIGGTDVVRSLAPDASPWLQWAVQTGSKELAAVSSQLLCDGAGPAALDACIRQAACPAITCCDHNSAAIAINAIRRAVRRLSRCFMWI
jgi:hypothetical protein